MSYANYRQIGNFGNMAPSSTSNPLTYCLTNTLDSKFVHGSSSSAIDPRSQQCQDFMAEYCANNWDGFCEYAMKTRGMNNQWPWSRVWPNMGTPNHWASQGLSQRSGSDQLLHDVGERRFCTYPTCEKRVRPFDPTNASSPMITSWVPGPGNTANLGCIPVCRVDPKTIDEDVVMNKMLANVDASWDTIVNICNTSKREGVDLSGTKLGAVCQRYHANMRS